jgi:hypothetical protein
MTTEDERTVRWRELYRVAMLEQDGNKLVSLLADATNAVLDRIEETVIESELEELNVVLNSLRSRRKGVTGWKYGRTDISAQSNAA